MPRYKQLLDRIKNKCAQLLDEDDEVQRTLRLFWKEARKEAEFFPPSYLLPVYCRLTVVTENIKEAAVKAASLRILNREEELQAGNLTDEVERFEEDDLILAYLNQDDEEGGLSFDSSELLESQLPERLEKRLTRDAAVFTAWEGSLNAAWLSAAVDEEMPPFEPSRRRNRRMRQITERLNNSDSEFAESLQRLFRLAESSGTFPLRAYAKLMQRNSRKYLAEMKERYPEKASIRRNQFIRLAERSERELVRRGRKFCRALQDRHNAKVLSSIYSRISLSSPVLSELLNTDLGSDWILDNEVDEGDGLIAPSREKMQDLFLVVGCFWDVFEALKEQGEPSYARREVAPKTARTAKNSRANHQIRLNHLKKAIHVLRQNSSLRRSTKEKWKFQLEGDKTGDAVVKGIDRLAKDCFGVEEKGQLPDQYRGFKSGGFANLVEDLFHGSWEG